MPSDIEPVDRERLIQLMRINIVRNALYHRDDKPFEYIDPFSAAIFEKCGILKNTEPPADKDDKTPGVHDLAAIMSDPNDARRVPAPPGPLFFVRTDPKNVYVLSPIQLLADREPDLRLAALRFFHELPDGLLAIVSRQQLEEARLHVGSSAWAQWFPAVKGLADLLHSDMYLTFAGFHQSYTAGYDEGISDFLQNALRPDTRMLTTVHLARWNPSKERGDWAKAVRQTAESSSLTELLRAYYRDFAHLPLTGELGLGQVIRLWKEKHSNGDCWPTLWAWADEHNSPLPRYHVCAALLANPELVPAGAEDTLWSEIANIVELDSDPPQQGRWTEAWQIRDDTTAHFGSYLECLIPGLPSEQVMGMALWLTE